MRCLISPGERDVEAVQRPGRDLQASAVFGAGYAEDAFLRPSIFGTINTEDMEAMQAERKEYDEDNALRQQDAKCKIVAEDVETMVDLLRVANEEIEEDWMDQIMPGNIYRVLAFGGIGTDGYKYAMKIFYAMLVVLIQWIAPPYLFLAQVYDWESKVNATAINTTNFDMFKVQGQLDLTKWHPSLMEWQVMPCTKMLQVLFITVFALNALWVLVDDCEAFEQADRLWDYLNRLTDIEFHGEYWLWLGALTHCWLVTWSVAAHFVLIGSCTDFKDVVFDSLGMLFLYNLDDVGGDLGFLDDDDWRGAQLKWMYDQMVMTQWPDHRDVDDEQDNHPMSCVCSCAYGAAKLILSTFLVVLPILSIITPWEDLMKAPAAK